MIAEGYNAELDEWRQLSDGATQYLENLEIRERESTGIDSLKIGFNAVHGYYIQISQGQAHKARFTMFAAKRSKMRSGILSLS
ncbi:DNA mismatch repair protein mutS [Mannheimia haemolytica]|uniref:DNA mismatch repair protein mutS n=1 Tax=Mannheimia haemolytica TaxID=75985 RepID=A0A378N0A1_MANHA|nr:DNA mismatch repair protein mutS [Mannheimia haemolytica]